METTTKLLAGTVLLVALMCSACGSVPPATDYVAFYEKPREATSAKVGDKSGEVCKTQILSNPILTFGESGYYKAAKDGDISTISTVSDSWVQIGGLFLKHCTKVTGT